MARCTGPDLDRMTDNDLLDEIVTHLTTDPEDFSMDYIDAILDRIEMPCVRATAITRVGKDFA